MPQIESVSLNDGEIVTISLPGIAGNPPTLATVNCAGQQSVVHHILVKFTAPVDVAADAFTLTPKTPIAAQGQPPSTLPVTVTPFPQLGGAGYSWILRLSGPGAAKDVLAQGVYDLTADPAKVTQQGSGTPLTGTNQVSFWTMFGGSAAPTTTVSFAMNSQNLDGRFGATLRNPAGPPAYDPKYDSNLDGACDGIDLSNAQSLQGTKWTF